MKVNVPVLYVTGWLEPPPKMCCGSNPQYLWMWPFLERGSADVKKRSWGLQGGPWPSVARKRRRRDADTHVTAGTGVGWCFHKPRKTEGCRPRQELEETRKGSPYSFQREPSPASTWTSDSRPPDCETSSSLVFSPPAVVLCYGSPRRLMPCIINKLRKQMIKSRISSF